MTTLRYAYGVLVLSMGLAIGCDKAAETGDGGTSDGGVVVADGTGGDGTQAGDQALPPEFLKFRKAGESVELATEDGSELLIVPYSVSPTESDSIAYQLVVEAGLSSKTSALRVAKTPRRGMRERNPVLWAHWQQRLSVEAWTRSLRERAARAPHSLPLALARRTLPAGPMKRQAGENCVASSECGADEVCHQLTCTQTLTLNVAEFAPTAQQISAKVVRKSSSAAILVEDGVTIDAADLDGLLSRFEQTILPRSIALFGAPALKDGQASPLAYDRNGDGTVWLVITGKVTEKKAAVGFFVATDFSDEANSNKADILWLAPPTAGETVPLLTTIAHELQHLLGYATKVYRAKAAGGEGTIEALWLDEGLSHLAEDLCGYGGENTTLLDQELFTAWAETSMITGTDGLPMRAMALTFLRYVFERQGAVTYEGGDGITDRGGAAWLKKLHSATSVGHEAITATSGDYKAAMDLWMATVALDGRNIAGAEKYAYAPLVTDTVTGQQIGLKIRGARNDASGAAVELSGPLESEVAAGTHDEAVRNASGKFWRYKAAAGGVKVTVSSTDSDVRFLVVKVK